MNIWNESSDSKFVARDWNIINDHSDANFSAENEIIYITEAWKSNICDSFNAYILVRGKIAAGVVFKNCAPFIKCITKTDETTSDDAEDLDLVVLMYNSLEYSSNHSEVKATYDFILKMKKSILLLIFQLMIILNLSSINETNRNCSRCKWNSKKCNNLCTIKVSKLHLENTSNAID